jgi:hypothetical protein
MPNYNGQMDDVKWFSSVISDSDIEKLSLNLDTTATPAGHWKLDGNANDSAGSYNGTWTGTAAYSDPAETPKYNGTPTDVGFLGTSFQPDLVWIKGRSHATVHILQDSVRGAGSGQSLYSDSTVTEGTYAADGYIDSLDANGFTVAGGVQTNGSSRTYVAWCWKAGGAAVTDSSTGTLTADISANTDAGFSIVNYTGNGTSGATFPHGLDSAAEMVIIKNKSASTYWFVYHKDLDTNKNVYLNDPSSQQADNQMFGADANVVTVGSSISVNSSTTDSMIAYCFHSVDGYQKIGSYTGTGSALDIDVGFRPRFVMIKRNNLAEDWIILDDQRSGTSLSRLYANRTNSEDVNQGETFYADGFRPRPTTTAGTNTLGSTLHLFSNSINNGTI